MAKNRQNEKQISIPKQQQEENVWLSKEKALHCLGSYEQHGYLIFTEYWHVKLDVQQFL